MRGIVEQDTKEVFEDRITPAHAGNSLTEQKQALDSTDHPRPCGE